jgi:hypothetical protein
VKKGSRRTSSRRSLLTATAVALVLAISGGSAVAASNIEGVWSFNGGQIAIQPAANGTYTGTVVVATKFSECVHPVGQPIWTEIMPEADGSYQGFHQWYFSSPMCNLNPTPGPTAWRVLEEPDGSSYLRVCFSHPGTSQPTIAENGSDSGATYGCDDSALTAPLPSSSGTAAYKEELTIPSAKKCLSLRRFRIHLLDPKYDPLKTVTITFKGRKVSTSRKGKYVVAVIDLKGLPRGVFTIKIHATTVLGNHLSAKRTYHTCIKKIVKKSSKKT